MIIHILDLICNSYVKKNNKHMAISRKYMHICQMYIHFFKYFNLLLVIHLFYRKTCLLFLFNVANTEIK